MNPRLKPRLAGAVLALLLCPVACSVEGGGTDGESNFVGECDPDERCKDEGATSSDTSEPSDSSEATGGTSGAAGSGSGATTSASAGSPANSNDSAGSTPSGGEGGTAGGTSGGGSGGAFDSTSGAGGTAGSAGSGGSPDDVAGGAGGAGGQAGVGGSASVGGAGNTGGTSGESDAGGATSGAEPSIAELVGDLDGWLIQFPCQSTSNVDDCPTLGYVDGVAQQCQGGALDTHHDFSIGGTPGATYLVSMHFYGIAEPKDYGPEAEREAGDTPPENLDTGAEPAPWAVGQPGMTVPGSNYGTNEIHVFDHTAREVGVYFVNSSTEEDRYTFVLDYERTIPVVGGGFVRVRKTDVNCRIMKNCGPIEERDAPLCEFFARTVDLSLADPPPPPEDFPYNGGLIQPGLGLPDRHSGQWWMIDVTAVESL